ncbi:MAG: hypothetical protein LBN32_03350 [Helicobacteraceae bacterium]|jgi:hypothetical protein|nr:hypothetical protein [Helicobacteraceae bacterium]
MTIGSVANVYQYSSSVANQSKRLNPTEFFQSLPKNAQEAMMKSISHLSEEEQQEEIRMLRNNYPFLNAVKPTKCGDVNYIAFFLSLPQETKEAVTKSISNMSWGEQRFAVSGLQWDAISDMAFLLTRAACAGKSLEYIHEYYDATRDAIIANPDKYLQQYTDPNEFKAMIAREIESMEMALALDPTLKQEYLPIYQDIFDLLGQNDTNSNYTQTEDKSGNHQLSVYA